MAQRLSRCEEEYGGSELELPAQHVRACIVYGEEAAVQPTEGAAAELAESDEEDNEICVGVLEQWLQGLRDADVDLLQYGRAQEAFKTRFPTPEVDSAFDAEAVAAWCRHIGSSPRMRKSWAPMGGDEHPKSELDWLPAS
ncbi:hypothetical protein LY76DRAFT_642665 [Colletotrichum caudatum]|nr:hypothetical protein LY76DRAFT_642665 [Colletotrichum caudatum]